MSDVVIMRGDRIRKRGKQKREREEDRETDTEKGRKAKRG